MRILLGVSHPKHVYIFKNVIECLINRGHKIKVVAVEKEMTTYLLDKFNIPYDIIGTNQPTLMKKMLNLPKWEYNTLKIANDFKPDIYVGRALPHLAHVSALLKKPFIIFEDTEIAKLVHKITLPFADAIVTPACYVDHLGKKHILFNSYFELGYLHPNNFFPDPSILDDLGLSKKDKFFILRFVAHRASHDIGFKWFDFEEGKKFINSLNDYGQVYITSEDSLPMELIQYHIPLSTEKVHHLLYYATMYIGGSGTMATESALLGTPSIHITSPIAVNSGNFVELEKKYGLMYTFDDSRKAFKKTLELLEEKKLKEKWKKKKDTLLDEKIDVAKFMTWFIEKYPESFYQCSEKNKGEKYEINR